MIIEKTVTRYFRCSLHEVEGGYLVVINGNILNIFDFKEKIKAALYYREVVKQYESKYTTA